MILSTSKRSVRSTVDGRSSPTRSHGSVVELLKARCAGPCAKAYFTLHRMHTVPSACADGIIHAYSVVCQFFRCCIPSGCCQHLHRSLPAPLSGADCFYECFRARRSELPRCCAHFGRVLAAPRVGAAGYASRRPKTRPCCPGSGRSGDLISVRLNEGEVIIAFALYCPRTGPRARPADTRASFYSTSRRWRKHSANTGGAISGGGAQQMQDRPVAASCHSRCGAFRPGVHGRAFYNPVDTAHGRLLVSLSYR